MGTIQHVLLIYKVNQLIYFTQLNEVRFFSTCPFPSRKLIISINAKIFNFLKFMNEYNLTDTSCMQCFLSISIIIKYKDWNRIILKNGELESIICFRAYGIWFHLWKKDIHQGHCKHEYQFWREKLSSTFLRL